jgi:DNA-binding Lrp family transcriptional regulator
MADIERSELDRILLANAKKSLQEISELTGLSEGDAATRLSELYRDRGALYELYREQALLEELWEMKDDLAQRIKDSKERNTAGLANAWRQVTSLVLDRYDKARERNLKDLYKVDEYHADLMGRALAKAIELTARRLNADEEEAQIIMEEVLPDSFKAIEESK